MPKAEKIMAEVIDEFNDWLQTRAFAPTVQALKQMMEKLEQQALVQQQKKHPQLKTEEATLLSQYLIQKITNRVAKHMRNSDNTSESLKPSKTYLIYPPNEAGSDWYAHQCPRHVASTVGAKCHF